LREVARRGGEDGIGWNAEFAAQRDIAFGEDGAHTVFMIILL
jgi:hypothetical protein